MLYGKREREKNVKKINKKWLKAGIVLVLLAVAVFRLREHLWDGLREITRIPVYGKIGILLASTGYMLAEGESISRLSRAFPVKIRWRTGVGCAYYCSFVRVITFGGGAGAAEIYYLSGEGMEPAHALDATLIQYLCQRVTATVLGTASLLLLFPKIEGAVGRYTGYFAAGVGVAVVVVAAILLVLLSRRTAGLLFKGLDWAGEKKPDWKPKTEQWKRQVALAQEGVKSMAREKEILAEMFLWNALKYVCWFSIPFLLYGDGKGSFWCTSVGLMAVATVLASVIPVPGGYGALEFVQLLLFEPVLGKVRTVSMVILYRMATTILPAAAGGGVAAFHKRKKSGFQQIEGE